MPEAKKVTIAGATGLIGTELAALCLENQSIAKVTVLVRSKMDITHPKLEQVTIDYDNLKPETLPPAEALFCCLGTTMKKAGSKEAFKKVDFDYVLKLAHVCEKNNVKQFHVVSAMGANPQSRIFYNRVKGNMEKYLEEKIKVPAIFIYRPSMLFGNRNEFRFGEKVGIFFMKVFSFVIPARYKGIKASAVARAMLKKALNKKEGLHVLNSDEIKSIAQ